MMAEAAHKGKGRVLLSDAEYSDVAKVRRGPFGAEVSGPRMSLYCAFLNSYDC
jgi:hypothetical protein